MVRIVLCDDNEDYMRFLKSRVAFYMQKNFPDEDCHIALFSSSMELQMVIEQNDIADIFILDVDMPGIDGFGLAKSIHDRNAGAAVFFVSSHMEHADQGYLVQALRYIDKARLDEKLEQALIAAMEFLHHDQNDYIVLTFDRNLYRIPISQILYVRLSGRKRIVQTRSSGILRDSRSLNELFNALHDPRFIFIDRGIFVNADYVRAIEENHLTLITNEQFIISRRLIRSVKQALAAYWGR